MMDELLFLLLLLILFLLSLLLLLLLLLSLLLFWPHFESLGDDNTGHPHLKYWGIYPPHPPGIDNQRGEGTAGLPWIRASTQQCIQFDNIALPPSAVYSLNCAYKSYDILELKNYDMRFYDLRMSSFTAKRKTVLRFARPLFYEVRIFS